MTVQTFASVLVLAGIEVFCLCNTIDIKMSVTSLLEEAIFYTWRQQKAIAALLHLGGDVTRSEDLYDQNFMQLKVTNSFELFF